MRPPVSALLGKLDVLRARKRPALRRQLRRGVAPGKLDAVSVRLGVKLPPALRALYRWHDGLRDPHASVEGHFGWGSLASGLALKRTLDQMERDGFFDGPTGVWWNPSWLPVLQFNLEDLVCVDLAGTLGKGRGAVFVRDNVDPRRTILAPSLHAWLHAHVVVTERGPDGADDDTWADYFTSPATARVRRTLDPGFPCTVVARRSS